MAYSCKQYGYWLLAKKAYAVADLKEKLIKKYSEQEALEVIAEFINLKLLDDSEYGARRAVFLSKSKSNRQIEYDLAQKGISEEDRDAALSELESEKDRLIALLSFKDITDENYNKWLAKLVRKGFSYKIVKNILDEKKSSTGEDS